MPQKAKGKDYKLSMNSEFRCPGEKGDYCGEEVYNCRNLLSEWPDEERGHGTMRLYCCSKCFRTWLFRGHRRVEWEKVMSHSPEGKVL